MYKMYANKYDIHIFKTYWSNDIHLFLLTSLTLLLYTTSGHAKGSCLCCIRQANQGVMQRLLSASAVANAFTWFPNPILVFFPEDAELKDLRWSKSPFLSFIICKDAFKKNISSNTKKVWRTWCEVNRSPYTCYIKTKPWCQLVLPGRQLAILLGKFDKSKDCSSNGRTKSL